MFILNLSFKHIPCLIILYIYLFTAKNVIFYSLFKFGDEFDHLNSEHRNSIYLHKLTNDILYSANLIINFKKQKCP